MYIRQFSLVFFDKKVKISIILLKNILTCICSSIEYSIFQYSIIIIFYIYFNLKCNISIERKYSIKFDGFESIFNKKLNRSILYHIKFLFTYLLANIYKNLKQINNHLLTICFNTVCYTIENIKHIS
jgi:hypothetical protein